MTFFYAHQRFLFDQKHSKNTKIAQYFYNLK